MIHKWLDRRKKKIEQEKGAVVIEATLSLSFFMFLICILLSITNICIAQAKIGIALNETAKEISQYSYIYTLSGLNKLQEDAYEAGEENRLQIDTMIDSVVESSSALKKLGSGEADVDSTWETLTDSADNMNEIAEQIAADPLPFSFEKESDLKSYAQNVLKRTDIDDETKKEIITEAYDRLVDKAGTNLEDYLPT